MSLAIYPGSFDPITNGHIDILKRALKQFDEVIILVAINPNKSSRFSIEEKILMIKEAIKYINGAKVDFTDGQTVDYAHKVNTRYLIRGYRNKEDMIFEEEIAKVYREQDKEIQMIYLKAADKYLNISSTLIDEYHKTGKDISKFVPDSVVKMYQKK